jgi:hypothetical protein
MRIILTLIMTLMCGTASYAVALAMQQDSPPRLTEAAQLRADLHKVRTQLAIAQSQAAQCQARLSSSELMTERAALEAQFRELLKPAPEAVFNWETSKFDPPPAAK